MTEPTAEDRAEQPQSEIVDAVLVPEEAEISPNPSSGVVAEESSPVPSASLALDDVPAEVPDATDFSAVVEPEAEVAQPAAPEPIGQNPVPQPPSATPPSPAEPSWNPNPGQAGSYLDLPPMPDLFESAPGTPNPAGQAGPTGQTAPTGQAAPAAGQWTAEHPTPEQAAGAAYGQGAGYAPYPGAPSYGGPQQTLPGPVAGYSAAGSSGYLPAQAVPGDTMVASMAHWLTFFTSFIGPLIILVTRGDKDRLVRANVIESLNFQLTLVIGYLVSIVLAFVVIGVVGLILLPILQLIFTIMGAIAASRGEVYRYPLNIRFLK